MSADRRETGEGAAEEPGLTAATKADADDGQGMTADDPGSGAADADAGGVSPAELGDGEAAEATEEQGIAELQARAQQSHERMLRVAADFDNYKRRARKELSEARQQAENSVVVDFLPVVDNLERALAHASDSAAEGLVDGVRMVLKQFMQTLARYDIEPIESVGSPFDPEFHEAIQQVPSEEPKGVVVSELQRGYRRGGRLVRPAMVVVSRGPSEPAEDHRSKDA